MFFLAAMDALVDSPCKGACYLSISEYWGDSIDLICDNGKCVYRRMIGDSCQSQEQCIKSVCEGGVCVGKSEGMVCEDNGECSRELYCDSIDKVCTKLLSPGEPSRQVRGFFEKEFSCQSGLIIHRQYRDICAEARSLNQTCSGEHDICIHGLYCDLDSGLCAKRPTNTSDNDLCNTYHPCADGFECRDGKCIPGSDVTCTRAEDCSNENCNCVNGKANPGKCSGAIISNGLVHLLLPRGCPDSMKELKRCAAINCKTNLVRPDPEFFDREGCISRLCSAEREAMINCAELEATRLGKKFDHPSGPEPGPGPEPEPSLNPDDSGSTSVASKTACGTLVSAITLILSLSAIMAATM